VADVRAPTPSAAAELAVPDSSKVLKDISYLKIRLITAFGENIGKMRNRLDYLASNSALKSPQTAVEIRRMRLDLLRELLINSSKGRLQSQRSRFEKLAAELDSMSPLKVLSRGYALVHDQSGNIVPCAEGLLAGDEIKLQFRDGEADCLVNNINKRAGSI